MNAEEDFKEISVHRSHLVVNTLDHFSNKEFNCFLFIKYVFLVNQLKILVAREEFFCC